MSLWSLEELLKLLASPGYRDGSHPGEKPYPEGQWAARMIKNNFGEEAVIPLVARLSFWVTFDPNNHILMRVLGFHDPEFAKRCKCEGTFNASWCLQQIPASVPILIRELKNEDVSRRKAAASALSFVGRTDAVEPLIDILSDSDKTVVIEAYKALKSITKKSFFFGNTDPLKWKKWWECKNKK